VRRAAKLAAKCLAESHQTDSGNDEDDSGSEMSEKCGWKFDTEVALSMSCDAIDSDSNSPWTSRRTPVAPDIVLTPSKLRTSPQNLPTAILRPLEDSMPLLKKENTTEAPTTVLVRPKRRSLEKVHTYDMPVLEKERDEDLSTLGPDSSVDSGWTSSTDILQTSLSSRCRRHLDVSDRRFGYDTREWRVPKLTIRRRHPLGYSAGNSTGPVSSTTRSGSQLIYEILPSCGHGSVESQPPSSDDSSYSDVKSSSATSSPDTISPMCFYSAGTERRALKRLRLKFGEESVAIDIGRS